MFATGQRLELGSLIIRQYQRSVVGGVVVAEVVGTVKAIAGAIWLPRGRLARDVDELRMLSAVFVSL